MKCNHCHNRVSKEDSICPYCGKEIVKKKIDFKSIGISIVVIALMILSPRSLRIFRKLNNNSQIKEYTETYSQYDFQDIIDNNLDEDSTVKNMLAKQQALKDYIDTNGYKTTDSKEYVMKSYERDPLSATGYLTFVKDDIEYVITYYYEKGELLQTELEIRLNKSLDEQGIFIVPEDKIKALESFIGISNITSLMKEKYPLMKQDEQYKDKYETITHEKYSIILREYISEDKVDCYYIIKDEK